MPPRGGLLTSGKPRWGYQFNPKSSCSFSSSSCSLMYLRIVSSSNPTVLTQYPLAQKCNPDTRFLPNTVRWINTALLPFKNPITNAILYFGATLKHIWMWSGFKCPSSNSTPHCRHRLAISPLLDSEISRTASSPDTWVQIQHGICNPIEHAINSSNHA